MIKEEINAPLSADWADSSCDFRHEKYKINPTNGAIKPIKKAKDGFLKTGVSLEGAVSLVTSGGWFSGILNKLVPQ